MQNTRAVNPFVSIMWSTEWRRWMLAEQQWQFQEWKNLSEAPIPQSSYGQSPPLPQLPEPIEGE